MVTAAHVPTLWFLPCFGELCEGALARDAAGLKELPCRDYLGSMRGIDPRELASLKGSEPWGPVLKVVYTGILTG